jgi:hypothetical protein
VHHHVSQHAWYTAVAAWATERQATQLHDVDPESVPADKIQGAAEVSSYAPPLATASIATNRGRLVLGLVHVDHAGRRVAADRAGRWLVDTVDWRAR